MEDSFEASFVCRCDFLIFYRRFMLFKESYSVAVIIPCWNCEPYIGQMLECLLNQTFYDWKAFLVDDGCTDGTASIIKDYALKDARVNYISRNRGPKGAQTCRNIGFELSKGAQYVVFFDADDLIAPYCLEQRVSLIENLHDVDFLSFPAKAFKNKPFDEVRWGFGIKGAQDTILSLLNWRTLSIVVSTNIYKRDRLAEKEIVWDENLLSMQDADFNIQAFVKGLTHGFADGKRIDYFYRQVDSSVSKQIYHDEKIKSHLYLINKEISSIRAVFGKKYDFYLKAYIVVFFEFFLNRKYPYRQLLRMTFVKNNPFFYLRILVYFVVGMRGKKCLFGPYCQYNNEAIRTWSNIVSKKMEELVLLNS